MWQWGSHIEWRLLHPSYTWCRQHQSQWELCSCNSVWISNNQCRWSLSMLRGSWYMNHWCSRLRLDRKHISQDKWWYSMHNHCHWWTAARYWKEATEPAGWSHCPKTHWSLRYRWWGLRSFLEDMITLRGSKVSSHYCRNIGCFGLGKLPWWCLLKDKSRSSHLWRLLQNPSKWGLFR